MIACGHVRLACSYSDFECCLDVLLFFQVNKNATLLKDLDGLFLEKNAGQLQYSDLKELTKRVNAPFLNHIILNYVGIRMFMFRF